MVGIPTIEADPVETAPIIIAPPRLTVANFGFTPCPVLDDLCKLWVDYDWDMDIWRQEIMPHKAKCELCADNVKAFDDYREWQAHPEAFVIEMEVINDPIPLQHP